MTEIMKYSVEITGPALSFLYYAASSVNEGFLLGKVEEKEVEVISDSNEGGVKQETVIRISGVFPCAQTSRLFHHETASLNEDILEIVKPKQGDSLIVGWFCGRRNCQFKPSFRETALHTKLSLQLSQKNMRSFVFVLVQDVLNQVSITREFQAKFFQFNHMKKKWSHLVGSVLNLNQKSSAEKKSLYRTMPTLEPSLLKLFEKQPSSLGLSGSDLIEGIIKNGHNYMTKSLQRISKLSLEIAQVELDIAQLEASSWKPEEDSGDEINNDGNEILANENLSEVTPPSPPVSSRRKSNVPGSSRFVKEENIVCESPTTREATTPSTSRGLICRKNSNSPTIVNSSSKTFSQEY